MTDHRIHNRVLIGGLPFRRYTTTSGQEGYAADGSALPFMIEEIISRSAVAVAVSDDTNSAGFVETLAPRLRDRVTVVDASHSRRSRDAVLAAVMRELGIANDGRGLRVDRAIDEASVEAVLALYLGLDSLFLGMQERLQIDIDLEGAQKAARRLREDLRSPEARACLAAVEGLLGSYRRRDVPGLVASAEAHGELVELFHQLAQDEAYLQAAEGAAGLGIPRQFERSLELMRRGLHRVVASTGFRQLFGFGSKVVATATQIPLPDSDVAEVLLDRDYLPPIVSLGAVMEAALGHWASHRPDLMHADPTIQLARFDSPNPQPSIADPAIASECEGEAEGK